MEKRPHMIIVPTTPEGNVDDPGKDKTMQSSNAARLSLLVETFHKKWKLMSKVKFTVAKELHFLYTLANCDTSVTLAAECEGGDKVIVKKINVKKLQRTNLLDKVQMNVRLLRTFDLPSIAKVNGYFADDRFLYILYPFEMYVNIADILMTNGRLTEYAAKFYLVQIVYITDYLHRCHVLYRGWNLYNCMIGPNGYMKIFDFSHSHVFEDEPFITYTEIHAIDYRSPEMVRGDGYSFAADWWQVGIIYYTWIEGCTPFYSKDTTKTLTNIDKGRIHPPKYMSCGARNITRALLTKEPTERLGIKNVYQIFDHLYFARYPIQRIIMGDIRAPYIPTVDKAKNSFDLNPPRELNDK
ncbi:hypothetical protein SNEBB_006746 [Seison nebaliae]|nr:hypothetical protein SNEBB_006746 [Seison nebaliae]